MIAPPADERAQRAQQAEQLGPAEIAPGGSVAAYQRGGELVVVPGDVHAPQYTLGAKRRPKRSSWAHMARQRPCVP